MMNILITGGTGLIGSALSQSLVKKSHHVTILSRNPQQIIPGIRLVSWEPRTLITEIEKADAVVNLAGESLAGSNPLAMRWTTTRKSKIINSRIDVGQALSTALEKAQRKPDLIIQASAIGYYGTQGENPADESSSSGADFLAQVCQSWEASTQKAEELGIRRIIARIGLVLSNNGGLLPLLSLPFRLFVGGPVGTGQQYMSWIHIADLVNSLEYFLENRQTRGIYNLSAPHPVTNREFASALSTALNRPTWLPLPGAVLKLALGEAATLALDGREVLPGRLLESDFQFRFGILAQALDNLFR
jgi:uncharacterized protein (TIGR01777 family)